MKHSDDQSLFAWGSLLQRQQSRPSLDRPTMGRSRTPTGFLRGYRGILAESPAEFSGCGSIVPFDVDNAKSPLDETLAEPTPLT